MLVATPIGYPDSQKPGFGKVGFRISLRLLAARSFRVEDVAQLCSIGFQPQPVEQQRDSGKMMMYQYWSSVRITTAQSCSHLTPVSIAFGRPMPRKLSAANDRTTAPMFSEIRTSVGNMALGNDVLQHQVAVFFAPLARAAST